MAAFQLSLQERQFLLAAGKGEGLFFARGTHVALKVEASPAEHRLATTAPRELFDQAGPAQATTAGGDARSDQASAAPLGEGRTPPRRRLSPPPEEGGA